jgi:NAD(P)-dependent dehydrogenase (short-subunit alcohol dehydrogenase family)
MQVNNKVVVITGAGSGIGRALAEKFASEGAAKIICVDINGANAQETADKIGGVAMTCDVSKDAEIQRVIDDTENTYGAIDLFCSNAGIGMGESEQSPDSDWQTSWEVNVMSHVYAARHLVPRMLARGGGYFMNTSSAAGLLNQIGSATYGVTKHAAIGFGEWLALTYAHQGIKVSMLCPQAVRTAMTDSGKDTQNVRAAATDGMLEPDVVADIVVDGLNEERFLILPHPEVETYMQRKTGDYDRWIHGMNKLQRTLAGD